MKHSPRRAVRTTNTLDEAWPNQVAADVIALADRMRAAVQTIEQQQPGEHRAVELSAAGRGLFLSTQQARTILRAIAPAALMLGKTKLATGKLNAAMQHFCVGLIATGRRNECVTADALAAALHMHATLGDWIDEMRWQQATSAAGVAWRRPATAEIRQIPDMTEAEPLSISDIPRQSTPKKREQRKNSRPPAPQLAHDQRGLLLPIPGGKARQQPQATTEQGTADDARPVARYAGSRR